ncbi:MAG: hypothetical protein PVI83_09840 [Lysobacterales bacterium]|jgi:hypothetical protein
MGQKSANPPSLCTFNLAKFANQALHLPSCLKNIEITVRPVELLFYLQQQTQNQGMLVLAPSFSGTLAGAHLPVAFREKHPVFQTPSMKLLRTHASSGGYVHVFPGMYDDRMSSFKRHMDVLERSLERCDEVADGLQQRPADEL